MDNLGYVWENFFNERAPTLFERFSGYYRAEVKETNDPLRMGRIRVLIPAMHNVDLLPEECPWAVSAFWHGGKGSGSWVNPIIGDIVWVTFEQGHVYGLIWTGFADPTRREFYPHQSIHGVTPPPVGVTLDNKGIVTGSSGKPATRPQDNIIDYLPKDERPMSIGHRDRYGSFFTLNSVGFYPSEHAGGASTNGVDPVSEGSFNTSTKRPKSNDPDVKYAVLHTKYGNTMLLNDVGYEWKNEFNGDFNADKKFEQERSKNLTKFFNENEPKGKDQRRIELRTKYGHKFEMRDVGWNNTRGGEHASGSKIISSSNKDERWVKWRTKAGHLFQMLDTGADSIADKQITKLLIEDVGDKSEFESEMGEDKRMIRLITRHGNKFVLDDRGSDPRDARNKETPHGNGFMIKTRRGDRGFVIEANDKDAMNRIMIQTPNGKGWYASDREGKVGMHSDTAVPSHDKITPKERLTDNKFASTTPRTHDYESNTHHTTHDQKHKYTRVKTPEQAGVEFRDCKAPCGSWSEMKDNEGRGVLLSRKDNAAIIRSKQISKDDNLRKIVNAASDTGGAAAKAAAASIPGIAAGVAKSIGAAVAAAGKAAGNKAIDKNKGMKDKDRFDKDCKKRVEAPEAIKATKDAAGKEANKQVTKAAREAVPPGASGATAGGGITRDSIDPLTNPEAFGNKAEETTRDAVESGADTECERQQQTVDMAGESGKVHNKMIKLDDDTDYIIIKNTESKGKIKFVANGNIEIIAHDIKIEAQRDIHFKAGREIGMDVGGTQWVVRRGHVGTNDEIRGKRLNVVSMFGTHESIDIPEHPAGPAPAGVSTQVRVDRPEKEESIIGGKGKSKGPKRVAPKEFDKEQGCAPNKKNDSGPVPPQVGAGGGDSPGVAPTSPPDPSSNSIPPEQDFEPNPDQSPDPFASTGGCLWYGTTTVFLDEIKEQGITLNNLANFFNTPDDVSADKIILAKTIEIARGEAGTVLKPGRNFAAQAKKRYGGATLLLRISNVPELNGIEPVENNKDIVVYTAGNIPFSENIEIFDVGTDEFTGIPEFPFVVPGI